MIGGYSVTGTVPQTDFGFNLQASLLILSTTKRYQSIAEGALPCSAPPTRALGLNARDGGKFVFLGFVNRVIVCCGSLIWWSLVFSGFVCLMWEVGM